MDSRLAVEDWVRAARKALLKGGPDAVRVERLARDLRVTKGSFYWHFTDRAELLEALISEWEAEADLLIGAIGVPDAQSGLVGLLDQLRINVMASEDGKVPSDAAIFAWASVDPAVDERVKAAEEERIALLATLLGSRKQAELAYMAYLGFILRRRTAANAPELFELFASLLVRDTGQVSRPAQRPYAKRS